MLKVGQKLYWVPNQKWHVDEQEVTVEKVGRKWATIGIGGYRIDIQTLCADAAGYSSPGTCYLDKEVFLAEREAKELWGTLRQKLGYNPPQGVTADIIRQVINLLKLEGP